MEFLESTDFPAKHVMENTNGALRLIIVHETAKLFFSSVW